MDDVVCRLSTFSIILAIIRQASSHIISRAAHGVTGKEKTTYSLLPLQVAPKALDLWQSRSVASQ